MGIQESVKQSDNKMGFENMEMEAMDMQQTRPGAKGKDGVIKPVAAIGFMPPATGSVPAEAVKKFGISLGASPNSPASKGVTKNVVKIEEADTKLKSEPSSERPKRRAKAQVAAPEPDDMEYDNHSAGRLKRRATARNVHTLAVAVAKAENMEEEIDMDDSKDERSSASNSPPDTFMRSESGGKSPRKLGKKQYACSFCGRLFSSSQALGGHQNAHRCERQLARDQQRADIARRSFEATMSHYIKQGQPQGFTPGMDYNSYLMQMAATGGAFGLPQQPPMGGMPGQVPPHPGMFGLPTAQFGAGPFQQPGMMMPGQEPQMPAGAAGQPQPQSTGISIPGLSMLMGHAAQAPRQTGAETSSRATGEASTTSTSQANAPSTAGSTVPGAGMQRMPCPPLGMTPPLMYPQGAPMQPGLPGRVVSNAFGMPGGLMPSLDFTQVPQAFMPPESNPNDFAPPGQPGAQPPR